MLKNAQALIDVSIHIPSKSVGPSAGNYVGPSPGKNTILREGSHNKEFYTKPKFLLTHPRRVDLSSLGENWHSEKVLVPEKSRFFFFRLQFSPIR